MTDDCKANTTIGNYMEERVDDQIKWYDNKSAIQKKWYYGLRLTTLICSMGVPFTTGLISYSSCWLIVTSMLGLCSAISEGIAGFTKVHEKWIQYRSTVELLRREKNMFKMRAGIYDNTELDVKKTFVERIETFVSSENINWTNLDVNRKEDKK